MKIRMKNMKGKNDGGSTGIGKNKAMSKSMFLMDC